VHGSAIVKAGYSFVSCSHDAVENGDVNIVDYMLTCKLFFKVSRSCIRNFLTLFYSVKN
jgi:hypothetical protein